MVSHALCKDISNYALLVAYFCLTSSAGLCELADVCLSVHACCECADGLIAILPHAMECHPGYYYVFVPNGQPFDCLEDFCLRFRCQGSSICPVDILAELFITALE